MQRHDVCETSSRLPELENIRTTARISLWLSRIPSSIILQHRTGLPALQGLPRHALR
jgi:hypothetical protein